MLPADLHDLLSRPDLDRRTRHLVLLECAIWPARWNEFDAVVLSHQQHGLLRADLEETLLQATLFFGFPRVVTAFEHLLAHWPTTAVPHGGALPAGEQAAAGRQLFAAIYGRHDPAVRARLASFHGEFHDFVLDEAYGRVLTRPGLEPRTRELLAAAALAVMGQTPQFVAHARGALHFGAGRAELREAVFCGLRDEAAVEAMLARV